MAHTSFFYLCHLAATYRGTNSPPSSTTSRTPFSFPEGVDIIQLCKIVGATVYQCLKGQILEIIFLCQFFQQLGQLFFYLSMG